MKLALTTLNDRMEVVTSDGEVKEGTIILDPLHHINKVAEVCKDETVKFDNGCGTSLRSAKKIEALIIDGIEIPIQSI